MPFVTITSQIFHRLFTNIIVFLISDNMNTPIRIQFDLESAVEEFRNQITNQTENYKRKKLSCATETYFTKLVQQYTDVNCVLRNSGVSFKKSNSRKKLLPIFNGIFNCKLKTCPIKFRIVLHV